jgi:hypothetical protein
MSFSSLSLSIDMDATELSFYDGVAFAGGMELEMYLNILHDSMMRHTLISTLPWLSIYFLHIPSSLAR